MPDDLEDLDAAFMEALYACRKPTAHEDLERYILTGITPLEGSVVANRIQKKKNVKLQEGIERRKKELQELSEVVDYVNIICPNGNLTVQDVDGYVPAPLLTKREMAIGRGLIWARDSGPSFGIGITVGAALTCVLAGLL